MLWTFKKMTRNRVQIPTNFNSNHLINGGHRLHVFLSLLFNCMIVHGHTPKDLLPSTIISITKDTRTSLCKSGNYRGISLFNAICKG